MADIPTTSSLQVDMLMEANWLQWRPAMTARLCQRGLWRVTMGESLPPSEPTLFEPVAPATTLSRTEESHNYAAQHNYNTKLEAWAEKDEKAQGNLLAHISTSQRVHLAEADTAYAMWQVLVAVHVQQVPGMRFSAYNDLFSITKGAEETLPAVASCVEIALACVRKLRPETITGDDGKPRVYGVKDLEDKLVLMAMLRALPRNEYADFVLSLMRTKDLDRHAVEAVFQIEQTKCNTHHGPLLSPSGDAALCAQYDARSGSRSAPSSPDDKCEFCLSSGHKEETCYAKERSKEAAQTRTKERQEERKASKKNRGGEHAAVALALASAAPTSPKAPTPPPKTTASSRAASVEESAARASVRLASTHDTHADVHWIADSGATSHMSTQRQWFKTFEPHVMPIRVANNAIVYSEGIGSIVMEPLDKSLDPVCLSCVLYVPALQNNLFAVLHLVTSHHFRVEIEGTEMVFLRNGARILTATICDKTAWLNVHTPNAPESALRGEDVRDRSLWHRRLGHIGKDLLEQAIKGNIADGLVIDNDAPLLLHCELCIVGKHHADTFPKKALHRATRLLQRIHSDVHMVPVPTSSGYRYWVTFINDWLRYGWIYLLKCKSDVFKVFKAFKAFVKLQYGVSIECLHGNKGGEYIGHIWDAYFAETGIRCEHTMEGMSQQGSVVERRNRMLEEHIIAMLNGARLPTRFWGEALYTYSHLLNMILSAAIPAGMTLFEMANKCKPDYSTLRVFGCRAWAHVRRKKRCSLEPHAKPCVFLGIPDDFKGWKLWDPSAQGERGSVVMSRDVIWNKSEFPGLSKEVRNPIPAHFGCTDVDKPLPDAPRFKEIDNCDEPEGAQPLPALIDEEDGLPPPDVEAPLPPLPDESDNSDFENDAAPSTKTLLSSSSLSTASPPHTPPRSTTGTPVPSAPRLAQRQAAPRLPMLPAPDLLRRSGRQTAGVLPNPNYTATQYLQQGRPEPHRVAMYKESRSCSTSTVPASAPASRQLTPTLLEPLDLPNVKEEADPAAPGPSQAPESPIVEENSDEFDFLSGPHAARLVHRWQGERALLAQGIESIYGEEEELLTLRQALNHAFVASSEPSEPKTFREAMQRPNADLWYQAAVKEMEAHIENGTWELVKLLPGRKAIGSQWVFKVKHNANGSVERPKARVVAKGFSQRPGVNFDETFAPTMKWAALRVIFALAALED
jgi:hypothetical protein